MAQFANRAIRKIDEADPAPADQAQQAVGATIPSPRRRNLWVTDAVEWRREARLA